MAGKRGPTTALDTSVIVAALLAGHEHHRVASPFVARLRRAHSAVLPLPALIESYSVLTRLPTPHRLERAVVRDALVSTFSGHATVVAIDGNGGWELLEAAVMQGVDGGLTYDLHIVACALRAGAAAIATFNDRHFERLDLGPMTLVIPQG